MTSSEQRDSSRIWLFIGSIRGYYEHPDMIGKPLKEKDSLAKFSHFKEIRKGDLVIYYDLHFRAIIGLFEISSDKQLLINDCFWSDSEVYRIRSIEKRLKSENEYFDYNKFYESNHASLKLFNPLELEKEYPHIEAYISQPKDNFLKIKASFSDTFYAKGIELAEGSFGPTGYVANQQMMSGLLDYYNSRSTSFVSLVVASLFGLVTLSAIIQSTFNKTQFIVSDIPMVALSLGLYGLFSAATLYTLQSYFFYANISDKIKTHGIENPYFAELKRIKFLQESNGTTSETSLIESICDINKRHGTSFFRKILKRNYALHISSVLALIMLGVFIYWPLITFIFPIIIQYANYASIMITIILTIILKVLKLT